MTEYRGTIRVKYIGPIFPEFEKSREREAKLFKSDPDGKWLAITDTDGYEFAYPSDLFEIIDLEESMKEHLSMQVVQTERNAEISNLFQLTVT